MEINIQWQPVLQGALAVGHRPKRIALKKFKEHGVTHVFTLLSEKEDAGKIGTMTGNADMEWIWLPFSSANPPEENRDREIREIFRTTKEALEAGARIFIHCSAGIHRTGMVSYALLRYLGFDPSDAKDKLRGLRQLTGQEVGDHRIQWGDEFMERLPAD